MDEISLQYTWYSLLVELDDPCYTDDYDHYPQQHADED